MHGDLILYRYCRYAENTTDNAIPDSTADTTSCLSCPLVSLLTYSKRERCMYVCVHFNPCELRDQQTDSSHPAKVGTVL